MERREGCEEESKKEIGQTEREGERGRVAAEEGEGGPEGEPCAVVTGLGMKTVIW